MWATDAIITKLRARTIRGLGDRVPANGGTGYMAGEHFFLKNPVLGQCPRWINVGSVTSCLFVPDGPVLGYGFIVAGQQAEANGVAATVISRSGEIVATDIAFAVHHTSDDNDQFISVKATEGAITATNAANPLNAHALNYCALRDKCIPGYDIFAAGKHTTVGGAAAEAITVTGVLASDKAFACYSTTNDTDVISKVACTADTVTVTGSADPGTAHVIDYVVLRQRGTFKPSHYVAYAGERACVAGDTTAVAITVTGALATDIVMVNYSVTDDTDYIVSATPAANALNLVVSADPLAAHSWNYALLRAYA